MISRRGFVVGTGGALIAVSGLDALARTMRWFSGPASAPIKERSFFDLKSPVAGSEGTIFLQRREDFLFLQVDYIGMSLKNGVLSPRGASGKLIYTFQPQHVVEQAVSEGTPNLASGIMPGTFGYPPLAVEPINGYGAAMLAGHTRLAFSVSRAVPHTIEDLLDWSGFTMILPDGSVDPAPGQVEAYRKPPGPAETCIEIPWNLVLAPNLNSPLSSTVPAWSHPSSEVAAVLKSGPRAGQTRGELWHTRLLSGPPEGGFSDGAYMRAVWSFDEVTPFTASTEKPAPTAGYPLLYQYPEKSSISNSNDAPVDHQGTVDTASVFPFTQSLTAFDRWALVRRTSFQSSSGRADLTARKLWLSTRGGFLDIAGDWPAVGSGGESQLLSWRHFATLGRDQYVKVVTQGYLFPFGHLATYVTISERLFQASPTPDGTINAPLAQVSFIAVREPFVSYRSIDNQYVQHDSRDFPFRDITLLTKRSPLLKSPTSFDALGNVFFPLVDDGSPNGVPFMWHFIATDWAGRKVPFVCQAMYVGSDPAQNPSAASGIRTAYNTKATSDQRTASFFGQRVAFGEPAPGRPGSTDLHVDSITFACAPGPGASLGATVMHEKDLPDVAPTLLGQLGDSGKPTLTGAQAVVHSKAAEGASGGGKLGAHTFVYAPEYVKTGFPNSNAGASNYVTAHGQPSTAPNPGSVFLVNAPSASPVSMVFGNGSSGGLMTPNIAIDGMSRALGPIANAGSAALGPVDSAASILNGSFNPASYFGDLESAKFLGGLSLGSIIQALPDLTAMGSIDSPNKAIPQISYQVDGNQIVTRIHWEPLALAPGASNPQPQGSTGSFINNWISQGPKFGIVLDGTVTTKVNADPHNPVATTFSFTGSITDFTFSLIESAMADSSLNFIDLHFDSIDFSSGTGMKTSVVPKGLGVTFGGSLAFLNQLQSLLSFGGDGGGLKIALNGSSIDADLSISLPPVPGAFFTIAGISFDAGVQLPLDGVSMTVFSFAFASAANPFTINGGIFAGGGYFLVKIGTKSVQRVEVSIFFGAMLSFNIIVASGKIQLTASLTLIYDESMHTVSLTLLVKLEGNLSILGLITLSLEFDLSLTYDGPNPNQCSGSATIIAGFSVFGFARSVKMTATKTFVGGNSQSSSVTTSRPNTSLPRTTSPPQPTPNPTPGAFENQVTYSDWLDYCDAFA